MSSRWHVPTVLVVLSLVAVSPGFGWGQEMTKVRLVHVAFSANQAVPWIAREAGYFQRQGLDVEKSLEKFTRITDRDVLEAMYRNEVLKGIEKVPLPSLSGIQTVLDELAPRRPAVRGKRPEDFVEARFVKELQANGSIDALYR